MKAARNSKFLLQEICVNGCFRKLASRDSFLDENFFILWQINIRDEPLHGLLHRPVVDFTPAPDLPQILDCYLLVLFVQNICSSFAVSIILSFDIFIDMIRTIHHIQFMHTVLTTID